MQGASGHMWPIRRATSSLTLYNCARKCGISFACTHHHATLMATSSVSRGGAAAAATLSNCSRAATHCPFANAEERGRLLAHVRAHLTTASAPSGAPVST